MAIPHNLSPASQTEFRIRAAMTAIGQWVRKAKEADPGLTDQHIVEALIRLGWMPARVAAVHAELTPQEQKDLAESLDERGNTSVQFGSSEELDAHLDKIPLPPSDAYAVIRVTLENTDTGEIQTAELPSNDFAVVCCRWSDAVDAIASRYASEHGILRMSAAERWADWAVEALAGGDLVLKPRAEVLDNDHANAHNAHGSAPTQ